MLDSTQPTHFLAVPLIDDASVAGALEAVHASLLAHDSRLLRACAPVCTAHVTLGVLHLSTDGFLQAAISALSRIGDRVAKVALDSEVRGSNGSSPQPVASNSETFSSFDLSFRGLNTFGKGKVLYVELVSDVGLMQLRNLAAVSASVMQAAGVPVLQSYRTFSPHLTVAKLSHLAGNVRSIRRIAQAYYAEHADITAGPVTIREVQLCAMGERHFGSYYHVLASVALDSRAS